MNKVYIYYGALEPGSNNSYEEENGDDEEENIGITITDGRGW